VRSGVDWANGEKFAAQLGSLGGTRVARQGCWHPPARKLVWWRRPGLLLAREGGQAIVDALQITLDALQIVFDGLQTGQGILKARL
jgi:hypothetical protein